MQFRCLHCPFNWLENLRKAKLKEEKVAVGVVVDLKFGPMALEKGPSLKDGTLPIISNHHFSRAIGYRNFRGKKDHLSSFGSCHCYMWFVSMFLSWKQVTSCSTVAFMFSVSISRDLGELSRKLTPNTGSLVCAGMAHKWLKIFRFGATRSPNDFHFQLRRSFVSGRPRCGLHIADPYILLQTYLGMVRDSQIQYVSVPHWNYRKCMSYSFFAFTESKMEW